ncbi:MAG: hypothetical protein J0J01_16385 [Reyranella sp.]|uniref:hypothetical protein n=1 Tax=Reyranella sp. TaxID=1929291 RepID=UPI001AD52F9A|nr:hypothetical protein [Reyranella sp.]MBN9088484.1 hypothetical protein [Reyranella sp.]
MGRTLLLLIAIVATLVVLGSWDNRRQMQRVLDEGYATTAQIAGAQYQRKMPLAADGWRPRFVEQELSVDLTWQGKDGKTHTFRKVPISDSLARTIVNGDQVRLIPVPVKVLDDESAVPVITSDASARLASLQSWLAAAGYAALAGWAGFAAMTLLPRRGRGRRTITAAPAQPLPPKRTFVGLGLLVVGGFLAFSAWSAGRSADSVAMGGQEVTADIVDATPAKTGYSVRLAWKDGQGAVHHYGPIPISEAYWNKITQNGQLTVRQATVRYRPDEPQVRPLIVDDAPEQHWSTRLAMGAGLLLMMFGAAFFASGLRARRNVS